MGTSDLHGPERKKWIKVTAEWMCTKIVHHSYEVAAQNGRSGCSVANFHNLMRQQWKICLLSSNFLLIQKYDLLTSLLKRIHCTVWFLLPSTFEWSHSVSIMTLKAVRLSFTPITGLCSEAVALPWMAWKSSVCASALLCMALIFTCLVWAWHLCVCLVDWVSLMTLSVVIRHKCNGRNGWADRGEGVYVCVSRGIWQEWKQGHRWSSGEETKLWREWGGITVWKWIIEWGKNDGEISFSLRKNNKPISIFIKPTQLGGYLSAAFCMKLILRK